MADRDAGGNLCNATRSGREKREPAGLQPRQREGRGDLRILFWTRHQLYINAQSLSRTPDGQFHRLTRLVHLNDCSEEMILVDSLPVDRGDDIVLLQARLLGRRAGADRADDGAHRDVVVGGRLRKDAHGIRDQRRYLLKNPLEAGASWTNVVAVSSIERYRIKSVDEGCRAPIGELPSCVVVEATNRADTQNVFVNEFTFAPGLGIVRIRTAIESGGRRIPQLEIALKSFRQAAVDSGKPR